MNNNNYYDSSNKIPASPMDAGQINSRIGNNITIRGNEIAEGLHSQKPSRNLVQANLKVQRFFRRCCRLIPFILRIHNLYSRVTSAQAKTNLANYVRNNSHLRTPSLIDAYVGRGYEYLLEAEWQFTQHSTLYQFLCPNSNKWNDRGLSFLE
jgi:hypothetical protein